MGVFTMAEMFAAVRVQKIKGIRSLHSIEAHGKREDEASKKRVDSALTGKNLAWSCVENDPLGVTAAFKKRKADAGATEYKGAPIGLHAICVVSPEWIAGAGDIHDPKNPRNKALFDAARAWGNETFGPGSVVAARMDMDEKGGGVVDLVVVPISTFKQRGKEKTQISVNKAYERAFGGGRVYSQMQDSWAAHAQKTLSTDLKRGKTKEETQREHVHADIIRPALQRAEEAEKEAKAWRSNAEKAEKAANAWRADAEKWRGKSEEMQKQVAEQKAVIEKQKAEISRFRRGVFGKLAAAREADLKEKTEEIRATESAKNDELLLRAHRAEGSLKRAGDSEAEALGRLHRLEEKYNAVVGEIGRTFPGAAREIRNIERDFDTYKNSPAGGGVPVPDAGVQHDDDEATRNLKVAAARESAVNARNASGPSM